MAILSSAFNTVSSGSVHCHVRTDQLSSATTEEVAVSIKQCEASEVTPALMSVCQGAGDCLVRADPLSLRVPHCYNLHLALKIIFICMDQVGGRRLVSAGTLN